jgi:hypothetical protein
MDNQAVQMQNNETTGLKQRTSIFLEAELCEKIHVIAKSSRCPDSFVIRQILWAFFDKRESLPPVLGDL